MNLHLWLDGLFIYGLFGDMFPFRTSSKEHIFVIFKCKLKKIKRRVELNLSTKIKSGLKFFI